MAYQGISDLVESCVEKILENNEMIEIRGTEVTDLFSHVPPQINYVANTRFTVQCGCLIESKRGGGGYMRIAKVRISDKRQLLEQINQLFNGTVSRKDAFVIIQKLYGNQVVTKKKGDLMLSAITKNTLNFNEFEDHTHTRILRAFLERLGYKDGK